MLTGPARLTSPRVRHRRIRGDEVTGCGIGTFPVIGLSSINSGRSDGWGFCLGNRMYVIVPWYEA
jgi:hypothetical protein